MPVKLRLTGQQHRSLHGHLLPDDGAEAVSIGICGRLRGAADHVLCLRKLIHIPYVLDYRDRYFGVKAKDEKIALDGFLQKNDKVEIEENLDKYIKSWKKNKKKSIRMK